MRRACKSVLATMNSISFIPASIMRLTALPPPPPTPITLILASLRASSLKLMRIPFSLFIFTAVTEFFLPWCPCPHHENLAPLICRPFYSVALIFELVIPRSAATRNLHFLRKQRNCRSLLLLEMTIPLIVDYSPYVPYSSLVLESVFTPPSTQTEPSDANSSGHPATRVQCARDAYKTPFRVTSQTRAQPKPPAFLEMEPATPAAPIAARLTRPHPARPPTVNRLHSE